MKIGMLWFDNDPKTELQAKIDRAASYYQNKYGQLPNLCFIHPSMIPGTGEEKPAVKAGRIEVRPNQAVLPNHFWIGVNGGVAG